MGNDIAGLIFILFFITITVLVVRNRINNIKDEQPDLGLADEQRAEVIPSTFEEAALAGAESYERYQRAKTGI